MNPGNGYRSNAVPSRISPETSIRSPQNFQRTFGRMHPKSPLPVPHQVSRRGDIFIEAGRLAVDYLISHGLLSHDVLSSNGTSRINNNLEFNPRNHEATEEMISPAEVQSAAPNSSEKSLSTDDAYETGKRFPVDVKDKGRLSRPHSSTDLSNENGRDGSLNPKEVGTNFANSIDEGARFKQHPVEISLNCLKTDGASGVNDVGKNTDKLSSVNVEVEKESKNSDLGGKDVVEKSAVQCGEGETDPSRKDCGGLLNSCNSELSTKTFTSFRPTDLNLLMMADGSKTNCQLGSVTQFIMPVNKDLTSVSSGSSDIEYPGSMDKVRGEKRPLENKDAKDNPKKVKDWPTDLHNEGSQLSFPGNECIGNKEVLDLPARVAIQNVNEDSAATGSMLAKGGIGPSMTYSEEKQFFPGSFKICDLNLMGVSDANETHDDSTTAAHSSNPVQKREISANIDLSMSNSCSLESKYEVPRGVPIIDLESDPLQGDKGIHISAERMQSEFPGLESFPSHLQNSSENPDVQDGYGLMLSEFIGTDIQNCSSAQPGVSSLQNDIGLHHGEGMLCDDDQIYMSLGEIPLSLLRSWDQPPQDYDKPF